MSHPIPNLAEIGPLEPAERDKLLRAAHAKMFEEAIELWMPPCDLTLYYRCRFHRFKGDELACLILIYRILLAHDSADEILGLCQQGGLEAVADARIKKEGVPVLRDFLRHNMVEVGLTDDEENFDKAPKKVSEMRDRDEIWRRGTETCYEYNWAHLVSDDDIKHIKQRQEERCRYFFYGMMVTKTLPSNVKTCKEWIYKKKYGIDWKFLGYGIANDDQDAVILSSVYGDVAPPDNRGESKLDFTRFEDFSTARLRAIMSLAYKIDNPTTEGTQRKVEDIMTGLIRLASKQSRIDPQKEAETLNEILFIEYGDNEHFPLGAKYGLYFDPTDKKAEELRSAYVHLLGYHKGMLAPVLPLAREKYLLCEFVKNEYKSKKKRGPPFDADVERLLKGADALNRTIDRDERNSIGFHETWTRFTENWKEKI